MREVKTTVVAADTWADVLFPALGFVNLQLWDEDGDSYCVLAVLPLENIRVGKLDLSKFPLLMGVQVDGKGRIYRSDEKLAINGSQQGLFCWFCKTEEQVTDE